MKQEELQAIASQLKHPKGVKGIEMANMMHETNINMTCHSIENLYLKAGDSILELGHGNAGHLPYLLSQNTNLKYYGLEWSELMFEEAQQINSEFVSENKAQFFLYDGSIIPFPLSFFNKIFTVNTVYFWEKPEELLLEIYRVLQPKGILSITFSEESFMQQLPFTKFEFELYSEKKARQLIEKTPFKILRSETLTEKIKSKTGELVDRDFTTLVMEK